MKVTELYKDKEQITVSSYLEKCGVKDVKEYLNPSGKYIDEWWRYNDIAYSCSEIKYWSMIDDSTIFIIQDGDTDGICSTVILYQYLSKLSDKWNIKILIHSGKQRGLDDEDIMDKIREERPDFVIIPDAGTNDYRQAEELCNLGIGLLVLDHHNIKTPIQHGTLVNNQDEAYDVSRGGSGALVTHKFLQGLDNEFGLDWSKYFVDMVALSLLSDNMDMSIMENREYYHFGLETKDYITNQFLMAMIDKFIARDDYTQRDISFKIVPKLNAICRCKDIELKQNVILAFIGDYDIDEALEMVKEAHENQLKVVENTIEENIHSIESCANDNLIIIASDNIPRSYSGLLAGKIKSMYNNKPTIVGKIKDGEMIGSLRSPIPLIDDLNNNELVEWASGHDCALGICIKEDNIRPLIDYYNSVELDYSPNIDVLKSYTLKSIPMRLFGLFSPYKTLWGYKVGKPLFYITNIVFKSEQWNIIGSNKRTLKLHVDGVDILIFNCLQEDKQDKLKLGYYDNGVFVHEPSKEKMQMSCIGELSINEWKGQKYPQIIVDSYEIKCYNKPSKSDIF